MSRFAVTIPRNPTGPILHTITKLHCYCKHSVLCIGYWVTYRHKLGHTGFQGIGTANPDNTVTTRHRYDQWKSFQFHHSPYLISGTVMELSAMLVARITWMYVNSSRKRSLNIRSTLYAHVVHVQNSNLSEAFLRLEKHFVLFIRRDLRVQRKNVQPVNTTKTTTTTTTTGKQVETHVQYKHKHWNIHGTCSVPR